MAVRRVRVAGPERVGHDLEILILDDDPILIGRRDGAMRPH
jgi:hypothetical protein